MQLFSLKIYLAPNLYIESQKQRQKLIPQKPYKSLNFMTNGLKAKILTLASGTHENFQLGVSQGCNQAKSVLGPHMSTNQQKNFIGMDISRFTICLLDYIHS